MKYCWRSGAGAHDNNTLTTATQTKARPTRKAQAKASRWTWLKLLSLPKQTQPCRIFPQTPTTFGALSCNSEIEHQGWIMGVTINCLSSTKRQAGAECLLLDSGAQLPACPIKYRGQTVPLLDLGIHTASGARFQHDGGRLVTFKLPEGRTIRVLFHACEVQKPIFSLGCLAQQVYWSDLRADTCTLFFLDKVQTHNTAKHSCTMKRVCSLPKPC